MNSPPRFALWLLARLGDEALTGDLLEHFGDRHRSPAWFRRQVFAAIAMRARWPEVVFALAGTLAAPFVWRASLPMRFLFPWAAMAWPWSQMVFELGSYLMVSIAPLPVLALGLAAQGRRLWRPLFATWFGSLVLLLIVRAVTPGLSPPRPYWLKAAPWSVEAAIYGLLLFFAIYLVAAWAGCTRPKGFRAAKAGLRR